MRNAPHTHLQLLVGSLPLFWCSLFVYRYAVSVPFSDQWSYIRYFEAWYAGSFSPLMFFQQHNEHRILFPLLVMFPLDLLTGLNFRTSLVVNISLIAFVLITLLKNLSASRLPWGLNLLPAVTVGLLICSPRQGENLLFSFQTTMLMCLAGSTAALASLSRSIRLDWTFGAATIAAVIASYSFASGLLIWPAGLILITLPIIEKLIQRNLSSLQECYPFLSRIVAWCVVGGLTAATYFLGWQRPSHSGEVADGYAGILENIRFMSALLGAPFTADPAAATWIGVIACLTYIAVVLAYFAGSLPWTREARLGITLIAFTFAFSAMTAIGRTAFGLPWAMTPRYISFTEFAIAGVIMITTSTMAVSRTMRSYAVGTVLTVALAISFIPSYQWGEQFGRQWFNHLTLGKYYLRTIDIQPMDRIASLTQATDLVYARRPFLEARRLSIFGDPVELNSIRIQQPQPSAQIQFHIDVVNDQPAAVRWRQGIPIAIKATSATSLTIAGWAASAPDGSQSVSDIFFILDDVTRVPVAYGIKRPDVARMLGVPWTESFGFVASLDLARIGPGQHSVDFVIGDATRYSRYQDRLLILVE